MLKGALLMLVWLGEAVRSTRDADLLGLGEITPQSLEQMLADVCRVEVERDGLEFLPSSIRVSVIRVEDAYGGLRATLEARLGKARLRVQLDVGVGDAMSPDPVWLDYPALLDFPRPHLRVYRPETAIAEKLHAMVVLGEANSRMRDFFDIHALAQHSRFEGDVLARALYATFERRRTPIPESLPFANEDGTIVGQFTDPYVDNTCQVTCTNASTCTFTSTRQVGATCYVTCGGGTSSCEQTPLCW